MILQNLALEDGTKEVVDGNAVHVFVETESIMGVELVVRVAPINAQGFAEHGGVVVAVVGDTNLVRQALFIPAF